MRNSYSKLFVIPGAIGFSAAAFLGRLPAGMLSLAIILSISKLTGSYTEAGSVAAAALIGMAICAPFSGRLVDHYGQNQILFISSLFNLAGTLALILCIQLSAPLILLWIVGALTGASRIPTGTLARTRWTYVISKLPPDQRSNRLQSAYAFEAIVDEIVFISGPILTVFLCTHIHPLAGIAGCMLFYLIGTLTLAIQRKTQPPPNAMQQKKLSAFVLPQLQVIFAATLFIGISAGAVEVVVVARADNLGLRSFAGILMAILAFSSMLSGFWYGARIFKLSAYALWLRCISFLILALIPFIFATPVIALAFALFIAGLAIAPTSVASQTFAQHILPPELLNEGMNIIVTGIILGMALGGWIAGALIDKFGVFFSGVLPALSVLTAFLIVKTVGDSNSKLSESANIHDVKSRSNSNVG